jgi:hypothetical protein
MGLFSWKTQDTNRSIRVDGNQVVYMVDNKGKKYKQQYYEGYGKFGGKDFHELVAEMNGLASDRSLGIDLVYSGEFYLSPNLVQDKDWVWRNEVPDNCEFQGYFYPGDELDEYN